MSRVVVRPEVNGEVRPEGALRAPAPGTPTLNQCTTSSSFSLRQCSGVQWYVVENLAQHPDICRPLQLWQCLPGMTCTVAINIRYADIPSFLFHAMLFPPLRTNRNNPIAYLSKADFKSPHIYSSFLSHISRSNHGYVKAHQPQ